MAEIKLERGTIIDAVDYGRFYVTGRVGAGAFGAVFAILEHKGRLLKAMKCEDSQQAEDKRLQIEANAYELLAGYIAQKDPRTAHFMELFFYGRVRHHFQALFLPFSGSSLDSIFKQCMIPQATAIKIALQCLSGLEGLHNYGLVHRDIKPANFVIGFQDQADIVFVIDLGMATKFCDNIEKMPRTSTFEFIGTVRYAPLVSHEGSPQNPKDDMESWFYVVLELFDEESIPWSKHRTTDEVGKLKKKFLENNLKGLTDSKVPSFAKDVIQHVRIDKHKKPDYDALRDILREFAAKHGHSLEGKLEFVDERDDDLVYNGFVKKDPKKDEK